MTIRNIDDRLKQRLRSQAARHGRSMDEETRDILRSSLSAEAPHRAPLIESIRARIEPRGGIDLQLPPREPVRAPPGLIA